MTVEKRALLLSGGTFLIIALLYVFNFIFTSYYYVIQNVPYYGIYTYQGNNARFLNDVSTSVTTIFDYWKDSSFKRTDLIKIETDPAKGGVTLNNLAEFFQAQGYSVFQERLTYKEFKTYINEKQRTPLLVFVPIDPNLDAHVQLNLLSVVVGVNERDKTLITNDYWYGYDHVVPWAKIAGSDSKATVLIVQPKDLASKLAVLPREEKEHHDKTELMVQGETMIQNYLVGLNHLVSKRYELAQLYFTGVEKDPHFKSLLPSILKVNLYTAWGSSYLGLKEFDEAEKYAQLAIEYNKDLDKPEGTWPGFQLVRNAVGKEGVSSTPYELMGDVLSAQKNIKEAEGYYKKALSIYPDSVLLKNKLSNL